MQRRPSITPYPRGWFMVARSEEVPVGEVKKVHYFDQDLVLFRGADGHAHATDPYCSHLGAHLGEGGTVAGNCLRCPFHGWQYNGDGSCANIPYAKKIPAGAKVYSWPVKESGGFLFAWFHENREAPTWTLPDVPELDPKTWTPWVETRWTIGACIQDISENDVDSAHLPVLHQFTDSVPEGSCEPDGPLFNIHMLMDINLSTFGLPGTARGPVETTKYGLGNGYVRMSVDIGSGIVIGSCTYGCTTPIGDRSVDVRLFHSTRRTAFEHIDKQLEAQYFKTFKATVDQDIRIWENKIHLVRPNVCEGDGPIMTFRKWARQFYSEAELERVAG